MSSRALRVLVVDDSRVIRELISDQLRAAGLEVAGLATDGQSALDMIDELRPDAVTLDVQMPGMSGLETLDAMLERHPVPVVMVSSLTRLGASIALEALDRGAMDYIGKPESLRDAEAVFREELARKIRTVAGSDVQRVLRIRRERAQRRAVAKATAPVAPKVVMPPVRIAAAPRLDESLARLAESCIAIGISTGGPPALSALFEALRPPLPPIVIVQHMPPDFTGPFATRLDGISKLSVKEAATGDILQPNHAYIAPGGKHLYLMRDTTGVKAVVRDGPPVSGHKPSVDVMMGCASELYGARCLGVIMTGMGRDGVAGCASVRKQGGYTLGQDEASSDVYGMNKAAFVEGHIDKQFHLDEAAAVIHAEIQRVLARFGVVLPKL